MKILKNLISHVKNRMWWGLLSTDSDALIAKTCSLRFLGWVWEFAVLNMQHYYVVLQMGYGSQLVLIAK